VDFRRRRGISAHVDDLAAPAGWLADDDRNSVSWVS
jgi:hypothetical protein